jgi:uncharacterized protein YjbJ (UPF0337 family)
VRRVVRFVLRARDQPLHPVITSRNASNPPSPQIASNAACRSGVRASGARCERCATHLDGHATRMRPCGTPLAGSAGSISTHQGVHAMNKDQIKGATKEVAGKVQRKAGEVTGSTEHQIKGGAKEAAGKMQKAAGDVKEAAKDSVRKP